MLRTAANSIVQRSLAWLSSGTELVQGCHSTAAAAAPVEAVSVMPTCVRGASPNMFPAHTLSATATNDDRSNGHLDGMLLSYRSAYPAAVYQNIASLPLSSKSSERELLELTACPAKLCSRHLKHRNFQVTSFDISNYLKFSRARMETYTVPDVESSAVPEIFKELPSKSLDVVCFFHTFHMLDTAPMLEEVNRILRCPGYLVAAWNDRDLSHPCNQDLEDILEAFNPLYSRYLRQRTPELWTSILTEGDMFRKHLVTTYENHLRVEHADHLVDLLSNMAFMNQALSPSRQRAFSQAVHSLVRKHWGDQRPIMLPLETRMYVMQRTCDKDREPLKACHCPL